MILEDNMMTELKSENFLNDNDISTRLFGVLSDEKKRLVITPLLLGKKQIKNGAIDLRLGTEFIITRKTKFSELDQDNQKELEISIRNYQRLLTIKFEDKIVLHPGQLILGSTFEYIKLPDDFIGYIIGRSSWGRLGLIIATATLIHPLFAGVITLELTNLGEVPIVLHPGRRIAQISFHKCHTFQLGKIQSVSRYYGTTHPNFSKVYKDKDIEILKQLK